VIPILATVSKDEFCHFSFEKKLLPTLKSIDIIF